MVIEAVAVLNLQFSVAPFSAARLFPVKVRVELMHDIPLVCLSMTLTPLTVSVGTLSPDKCVTVKSPAMKEPLQMVIVPGSLQV